MRRAYVIVQDPTFAHGLFGHTDAVFDPCGKGDAASREVLDMFKQPLTWKKLKARGMCAT